MLSEHQDLLDLDPVYAEVDAARKAAEHAEGRCDPRGCQPCLEVLAREPGSTVLRNGFGEIVLVLQGECDAEG